MIQVYSEGNTNYTKNGDMTLNPTEATVTAELGGAWSACLKHPIDEEGRWRYLTQEAVVRMPSFNGDQLFRIRERSKDDTSVTCSMVPLFFDSMNDNFIPSGSYTDAAAASVLRDLIRNSKYSIVTDLTTTGSADLSYTNLIEALSTFTEVWGGELEYDNHTAHVLSSMGSDRGITLRYGLNIPVNGVEETVDMTDVITRLYPRAYNDRKPTNVYIDSPLIGSYPTIKCGTAEYTKIKLAADATQTDYDNPDIKICADQTALNNALGEAVAAEWAAGLDKPAVSLKCEMILLAGTEQYKEYGALEDVSLGDTVHLYHTRLGITSTERVIGIEYDSVSGKTSKVTLGVKEYNYFNSIDTKISGESSEASREVAKVAGITSDVATAKTNITTLQNEVTALQAGTWAVDLNQTLSTSDWTYTNDSLKNRHLVVVILECSTDRYTRPLIFAGATASESHAGADVFDGTLATAISMSGDYVRSTGAVTIRCDSATVWPVNAWTIKAIYASN